MARATEHQIVEAAVGHGQRGGLDGHHAGQVVQAGFAIVAAAGAVGFAGRNAVEHGDPVIGTHVVEQHQCMHIALGQWRQVFVRQRTGRDTATQHAWRVAAHVTHIVHRQPVADAHQQPVLGRHQLAALAVLVVADNGVFVMQRQTLAGALAQRGRQVHRHADQIAVDGQLGRTAIKLQARAVGAAAFHRCAQRGDKAQLLGLAQAGTTDIAFGMEDDVARLAGLAFRIHAARQPGLAAEQPGLHIAQREALVGKGDHAGAAGQQRRGGRDAHIVALERDLAIDLDVADLVYRNAERQRQVGLAGGAGLLQRIAGNLAQRRGIGQMQRLRQRSGGAGGHAHGQVARGQIGNGGGQFTHAQVGGAAETGPGVHDLQHVAVDDQLALQIGQGRPGQLAGMLQAARHELVARLVERHVKAELARQLAAGIVLAGRQVFQIAFDLHARVADLAGLHRIAHIGTRLLAQRQRQVAMHARGIGALHARIQLDDAGEARRVRFARLQRTGAPVGLQPATGIGIGKAHIGQGGADHAILDLPEHLGIEAVEGDARLLEHAGQGHMAAAHADAHAATTFGQRKLHIGTVHARRARLVAAALGVVGPLLGLPADVRGLAHGGKAVGLVKPALPVQRERFHVAARLEGVERVEGGIAQRQAAGQLADDAQIPVVAFDMAAAAGTVGAVAQFHAHIAVVPALAAQGGEIQLLRGQRVGLVVVGRGKLHAEHAAHVLQHQWRQVLCQSHIDFIQVGFDGGGAAAHLLEVGPDAHAALAAAQVDAATQAHVAAQFGQIQLGQVGIGDAGPVAPDGAVTEQRMAPFADELDRLAPAGRRRGLQLQLVAQATVFQGGTDIGHQQRRCIALGIAPAQAALRDGDMRLRQQPVQRRTGIARFALCQLQAGNFDHAIGTPLHQQPWLLHLQPLETQPQRGRQRYRGAEPGDMQAFAAAGIAQYQPVHGDGRIPATLGDAQPADFDRGAERAAGQIFQCRTEGIDSRQNDEMQEQCQQPDQAEDQHQQHTQPTPQARQPGSGRGCAGRGGGLGFLHV